jgi:uncharacterized protein
MLQNTFCHLSGLGAKTERRFWESGILTWEDFLAAEELPVGNGKAEGWRSELTFAGERRAARDAEYFGTLLDAAEAWRLYPDFADDILYLDIETDGGREQNITTIAAYGRGKVYTYVQGINLEEFEEDAASFKVLATYNGRCFDAPQIERQLHVDLPRAHIDLRSVLCRLGITGGLKKCEKQFGLDRKELDGVDGYFAVLLWREYDRYGKNSALETLLAYNVADVLSLEILLAHAMNAALLETPFASEYAAPIPEIADNPHEADARLIEKLARRYVRRR